MMSARARGYTVSWKNVPENRNIGKVESATTERSCHVRMYEVIALPIAAKDRLSRPATGRQSTAQNEVINPKLAITVRKPEEYSSPLAHAHPISPSATSPTESGVASTAS